MRMFSKESRSRRYDLCYIIRISQANISELLCCQRSIEVIGLNVRQKFCIVPTRKNKYYDQEVVLQRHIRDVGTREREYPTRDVNSLSILVI